MLCNSGLALGLSQEDVIKLFSPFGAIESVAMLPDKTYCFVAFRDVSNASNAYGFLHGKSFFPNTEVLIVLAFASKSMYHEVFFKNFGVAELPLK